MQILDEILFFLIARRCLQEDNNTCRIGLGVLLRQLSAHSALFPSPRILRERIRSLQAAGVLSVIEEIPRPSVSGRGFSSLSFQVTAAGLAYIDRLCPVSQADGEESFFSREE